MEPAMTPDEHLHWIRIDADRMADASTRSSAAPVPACPGWDVGDLLSHTGWVHRLMRYMVCLPEGERPSRETMMAAGLPKVGSAQHPGGDLVAWFRDGVDQLLAAFTETPPTKTITSLFGTHTSSLLIRRMAHETAIHRWDVEDALGPPNGFDRALAIDGIDELLEIWVPMTFKYGDFGTTSRTIELRVSDGDDAWAITVGAESTVWHRGDGEGAEVTARGRSSDLYLFAWNRRSADPLEVVGDRDLLARWQAAATV